MNASIKKYINDQITTLENRMKKNKTLFFTFTFILMTINIVMVSIAGVIIGDLIKVGGKGTTGLILASFAAITVITIFALQIGIILYRSLMKEDTYKIARDKIQVEVFKYNDKREEYKNKDAEAILTKNVLAIKKHAEEHKRHKTLSSIVLKGFTGGEDE